MMSGRPYRRVLPNFLITGVLTSLVFFTHFNVSAFGASGPSVHCHTTDGAFTTCTDGSKEWSDVPFKFFPGSNSYLYADQADLVPSLGTPLSPVDTFMLMYDECRSTTPLGPNEYVRVGFTTVEVENSREKLKHYVLHIFTDGTIIFIEDGVPQANNQGKIRASEIEGQRGKVGFGPSPNCPFNHVFAEFEIKLSATSIVLNGGYSPDPQFWGAQAPCDFKCSLRKAEEVLGGIAGAAFLAGLRGCDGPCTEAAGIWAAEAAIATGIAALDPPDPNFMVLAEPHPPSFAPITPRPGVSQGAADAWNVLLNNHAQVVGLLDAWLASFERAQGATLAGDTTFAMQQLQRAAGFATQLSALFNAQPALGANLQTSLLAGGFSSIPITAQNIADFQANVAANGLPPSFVIFFNSLQPQAFGLTREVIRDLARADILAVEPSSFPELLTDPRRIGSSQESALGFDEFARSVPGFVQPIRPGFDGNTLPANDDGSTGRVPIGFPLNFFGTTYETLFVNNNGNVTFDNPLSTFTPFPLTTTNRAIIAPFFADVDTRVGNVVTYGQGTVNGRAAFGVNWPGVGCYSQNVSVLNFFQMRLIDRSDTGAGNFDIVFGYDSIQWETGQASGGNAVCQGGAAVRVGYSNGTGNPGTFFELPGSAIPGSFLDSNLQTGLRHRSPIGFSVRSGVPVAIVDRDGDGVPDELDNCPTTPNRDQADGNFNGIGNVCELGGTNSTAAFLQAGVRGDTTVEPRALPFAQEPTLLEKLVRIVTFRVSAGFTNSITQLTANLVGSLVDSGVISPQQMNGLVSDVIKQVDTIPPTTTATLSPLPNANGWNNVTIRVATSATDNPGGSGVATTYYAVDNPACTPNALGSCLIYSGAFTISVEGKHIIYFFSGDNAGNLEAQKSQAVNIDRTPPTLTCVPNPSSIWPPNHKLVDVTVVVNVTDNLSGPAGFKLLSVTSNEPDDGLGDGDTPGDIQGFAIGTSSTRGQLRAERSGMGTGRVYTLTYQGMDKAGNTATCSATVTVPHDQGK